MKRLKTDWNDVRSIIVDGKTIRLATGSGDLVLDCNSASELSEVLRFWARNDIGQVRLPEGSSLVLRETPPQTGL